MTIALRPAAFPRGLVLAVITLGLLVALAAATLYVGGRPSFLATVVPPSGPAANGLIAFDRGGDIWVVEPIGAIERRLVSGMGHQQGPSWSRDGTRLAYWSSPSVDGPWELVVVDADGSDPVVAATEIIEPIVWGGAEWSPDGTTLLFATRTIPTGVPPCTYAATLGEFCSSRIFTAAADGSSRAVAVGDPELDARSPAWSPDGSAIAFGGGDARDAIQLHVMSPDGSTVRQVGDVAGAGWSFVRQSWSPDGARIAAQVGQSYWDIVVIPVDGGEVATITDTPTSDELGPSYAHDGALAWYGSRGDPCCLQVLEPGGDVVDMVGGPPVWSPDGTLIASEGTDGAVLVVDRDGEIVATIEGAAAPSWQRVSP